ncbi:hypothetical protein SNEBB_007572 [Seison nebaliae]|nr:hypothetical protein SNEBB_007572 [Seison nebaliae]
MEIEMNVSQTIPQLPYHVHLPGTTVKFDCEPYYSVLAYDLVYQAVNGVTLRYIHFGDGSIINNRYLLTVAHCVYTGEPYQQNKINLSSIHVAFSTNLKEVSQLNKTEIDKKKYCTF